MRKFIYVGPPSGATLRLSDRSELEVALRPGRAVELPAEHSYTRRLLARRLLVEPALELAPKAPERGSPSPQLQGDPVQGGGDLPADGSEREDDKPKKKGKSKKGDS